MFGFLDLTSHADFLQVTNIGVSLERLRQPFVAGTERDVFLVYRPRADEPPVDILLKTKIQQFHPFPWLSEDEAVNPKQLILTRGYNACTESFAPNNFYAIPEDCLPSVDDLVATYPLQQTVSGPFNGVYTAFTAFAHDYCAFRGPLPLVGCFLSFG